MCNSLFCSRHHRVISCDDNDCDISNLSTTSTHSGKCLMTRSIKECNLLSVLQSNTISTNMLSDTTSLTSNHIRIADMVKQRCFTMVYVSHYCNDWSTRTQVVLIINHLAYSFLNLCTDIFSLKAEFISNHVNSLCIKTLINRNHNTDTHKS